MKHIYIERSDLLICPADTPEQLTRVGLAMDIFELLSEKELLRYLPEKRVKSVHDAESWLGSTLLNLQCGRNQTHLIISKKKNQLIGVIDIIPPAVAKEHYQLNNYPYFIEFYLRKSVTGKSLMSGLLPQVIRLLRSSGIQDIAAIVNRNNTAALKVLQKSGFDRSAIFDLEQDLYQLSA
ncbi:GNAT family N-acetyltransferase [Mucilaginibacter terrae]|uniref:RimJ/RimL family protein N-acetyltransferase n=1 Tax=Mucilaginibacter terrae TaxID=1955052 RepID=A0ABU3GQJ1_9SPHI|nr:GNAT family N-acetyltransferase [Mucilaginibacter terrae]MDT3401212.1 RimJ/RimL family protein N-acetyltransferase [Mucilaginibacter terrae]